MATSASYITLSGLRSLMGNNTPSTGAIVGSDKFNSQVYYPNGVPTYSTTVPRETSNTSMSTSGGSGGSSASERAANAQNIKLLNLVLGNADNDYAIGQQRLADQYTQGLNKMNSDRSQAEYDSGQQVRDNTRALGQNEWNVLSNTGRGMNALARLLGAYGVTGTDQLNATDTVTSEGNEQMGKARTTAAQNARNIDDSLRKYVRQWEQQKAEYDDSNASARADLISNRNASKISALNQLATLYAQNGDARSANNTMAQISNLQNESANTQRAVRPTANMTEAPVLERRSLADFIPAGQSYFETTASPTSTSSRVGVAYRRRREA